MEGTFQLRYASHLGIRSIDEPLFANTLGSLDPVKHIDYAAEQGFAGIEDNFFKMRSSEQQSAIGRALERHGMELGCIVSTVEPGSTFWVRSDADADAHVDEEVESSFSALGRAGGRYLVIAPARDLQAPMQYQLLSLIRHLRRIAPIAERAGVTLCLEMTSELRYPGQLLHHIADAKIVIDAVSSPAVKLLLDLFHVQVMDGNLLYNLGKVWGDVAIIQISDVPNRTEIGIGEINWKTILLEIKARQYRGLIEYEIYPSKPGIEGEQDSLSALRRIDALI